jgi:dihydrofolate reductase
VAGDVPEVCVIGGADIYRVALPVTDVLHLTRVHGTFDADAFFPPFDPADWVEVAREDRAADDRHAWAYSFLELRRPR